MGAGSQPTVDAVDGRRLSNGKDGANKQTYRIEVIGFTHRVLQPEQVGSNNGGCRGAGAREKPEADKHQADLPERLEGADFSGGEHTNATHRKQRNRHPEHLRYAGPRAEVGKQVKQRNAAEEEHPADGQGLAAR